MTPNESMPSVTIKPMTVVVFMPSAIMLSVVAPCNVQQKTLMPKHLPSTGMLNVD